MAAFPTGLRLEWRDMTEAPEPVVERTEMDRGVAKQRRIASDVRLEMPLTIHFDTAAEIDAFETWFYSTVNAGQDWFDMPHPRTGATLQARIVGGKLGPLSYLNRTLGRAKRTINIEWWRSAW